jgi:LysR family transcriptional regulator, transcriptional activator of the cysJI operon
MSKGGAVCGVSQSAASQHVQEVERKLSVALFDRSKRPLELTPAGKLYYDFCRDLLNRHEQFELALEQLKGAVEGTCHVASIYSVGLSEMSRLQEAFSARHPAAHLHVEYERPDRIYEAVRNGAADLGLVSYPLATREIAAIPWRLEEMHVAVPPAHPLAAKDEIAPEDLDGLDYIGFDEELPISREVNRYLRAHGVSVNQAMHFDNIQMIKEAVALGSGIAILPARTMRAEIAQGRLLAVRLKSPGITRPIGIAHRRRKKFNAATQSFLDLLLSSEAPQDVLRLEEAKP